ncbi:MAG: nucleotidyl transferase AbiEii/AbiGii toxin family protein [Parvularculales bacterium]
MISPEYLDEWAEHVPWVDNDQIEKDLIVSKAMLDIYSQPKLRENYPMRGGTAFNKLHRATPARFSEDIDMVQLKGERIGETLGVIRSALDPWLGEADWDRGERGHKLLYHYKTTATPDAPSEDATLKVEINTREHDSLYGTVTRPFSLSSPLGSGKVEIPTYTVDELMGTKLRALYQRRKGRDLFDLGLVLDEGTVDPERLVKAFNHYMINEGGPVGREQFHANFIDKIKQEEFGKDITRVVDPNITFEIASHARNVIGELINRLPHEQELKEQHKQSQSPVQADKSSIRGFAD